MRVLLVKTSSMGDVIHTFPAVTDAVKAVPGLQLDWAVEPAFADLVALHPGVAGIHDVEFRRWWKQKLAGDTWRDVRLLRDTLRHEHYDLVIDAQGLMKSAAIARLAGAPVFGFDRKSAREDAAAMLYRRRLGVDRGLHAIERTRLLLAGALGYEPDLSSVDYGLMRPRFGAEKGRTAFLLHGTNWEGKKWPVENWQKLAALLVERKLAPVTTWGNEAERLVAEAIAAAVPETRIVRRSTLMELAEEIAAADLVFGVDTGLTHLAAAFGKPTVAIFLATNPGLTGPVGDRVSIVMAPGLGEDATRPRRSRQQAGAMVVADAVTPETVLRAAAVLVSRKTSAAGPDEALRPTAP